MPVVPFDARDRLLSQARAYIGDPGLFLKERDRAVPLLLRALRPGDLALRRDILFLLGSFAKEEVARPLYEIMSDPEEPEELRDQAAIHLSVIGAFLEDPQPLVRRLLTDLESLDIESRVRSIMALGWEGNFHAVLPLIECLYDPSEEVQEVAVSALCNLRDSRVVRFLADRLDRAAPDQKRAILFNLWRFGDRVEEVSAIYRRELQHGDPSLRLDVLILLGQVGDPADHADLYRRFLKDPDARVRALALERLAALKALTPEDVLPFLDDPDMGVKRAAMKAMQDLRGNE